MGGQVTIYRYGLLAWFWRVLIAVFFVIGGPGLLFGARNGSLLLVFGAMALLAPALFFGTVLAVRVDRLDDGQLRVWTLLFWRRHIPPGQLGLSRLRESYEGEYGPMYAPRLWVRVRRRLPIYLDLLATIPDRRAFAEVFRVPISRLPGR